MPTTTRSGGTSFADDEVNDTQFLAELGRCEIEVTGGWPSVLERVRYLVLQHDDDVSAYTDEDVAEILAFCAFHELNKREAAELTAAAPHEVREKRGLWQNILLNLRGYEEGDAEAARDGAIPVAEVHVPAITGCECKYTQDASVSKKVGVTIKVRGVGGGGGKEAKVTFSNIIASPACGQVTIPGTWQLTPWFNPDLRSRIDVVNFSNFKEASVGLRTIPPSRVHRCAPGVEDMLEELKDTPGSKYEQHPLEIAGSSLAPMERVEETRELTLLVDEVLEVKSQFMRGFAYEWKIFGAANYLRFFEDERSHVQFWHWDALT